MKYLNIFLPLTLLLPACMEQEFHSPDTDPNIMHDYQELSDPDSVEERFYNPAERPVNMIFSIDRSGSMGNDQQKLWDNMDTFISILDEDNIDYRVAVISTEGRFESTAGLFRAYDGQKFISPKTQDPTTAAQALLDATAGYGEDGIDAMYGALEVNYTDNHPFWRAHTPLHLLTISDEPDQSIHVRGRGLYNKMKDYEQSNGAPVTYSSVVHLPEPYSSCDYSVSSYSVGTGYIGLTSAMGGILTDICDPDWTESINEIAYLATEQSYEYFLGQIPQEDTLKVFVEDGQVTFAFTKEDWTYNPYTNSIAFTEYVPNNHQVISIQYLPQY